MALVIKSGTSADLAAVTAAGELKVSLPTTQVAALSSTAGATSTLHPSTGVATANSASAAFATLTNNNPPAYSTLGGKYQWKSVAGSLTNTYPIFGYQVPVGYTLYIKSVFITMGSFVTKPTTSIYHTWDWSLGINSTGSSLATAESPPSTYAPRLIPLGIATIQGIAQYSMQITPLKMEFASPIPCLATRYCHIAVQIPYGTTSSTMVQRGVVAIDGYFV
jgi:hypothetical protein